MILLLGGTIDSREIGAELQKRNIKFITTTVSDYGKFLAEQVSDHVIKEILDEEKLPFFIRENNIRTIIDSTHPFARNVSENAIKASNICNVTYYRFERPDISLDLKDKKVIFAEDIKDASKKALEIGNRILLTTGSRGLMDFTELIKSKKVFARVLPELLSIQACEDAGIKTGEIIAMQGPFSEDFNKILINEKNIDLIITKESGKAGGLEEKISSALSMGINIIIIKKPGIDYPVVFLNKDDLVNKIMEEYI